MTLAPQLNSAPPLADGREDVPYTLPRVREAQLRWAAAPLRERLRVLRRLRHSVAEHGLHLARLIDGRNRVLSQRVVGEVLPLADSIRFLEREAGRILRPVRWGGRARPLWLAGTRLEVRREPLGVVLVVGPSNYPLLLPGVQALQAIAAGNAVLMKPAPGHTEPVAELRELAVRAGLHCDLWTILPEDASSVQLALGAGVDKVLLTGSAETGAAVLADLAPRIVPATMELSGCDAVFVCPDADLALAARALAFALSFNGGATCIAPRRVFCPRTLRPALRGKLEALLRDLPAARLAPNVLRRVETLLQSAATQGAEVVGGAQYGGQYFSPAVAFGVPSDSPLLSTDLMAPVLSVVPVDDMEQAICADQSCPFALGATIFGSERSAAQLTGRIRAGVVLVNDVILPHADPRLPFGGRGRSGFGVTRGAEGLLELTRPKAVSVRRGTFRPHFDAPRPGDEHLFASYLSAAHGGSLVRRARAALRLLQCTWQRSSS